MDKVVYQFQADFSAAIFKLFDGGFLSNIKKLFYPLGSSSDIARDSDQVSKSFLKYKAALEKIPIENHQGGDQVDIKCEIYSGRCDAVCHLGNYLKDHLQDELVDAFVHGSLGSDEEVNYSDFDALLIFKDRVFENTTHLAKVVKRVLRARKYLFDYDPFQHHGFFVLCESDLVIYPESVFPLVLFGYSKSLIRDGKPLSISLTQYSEISNPIWKMLGSIEKRIQVENRPRRLYELKSMLSHIMLLPCLILQSEGIPIFKRESFARIQGRFSADQWKSIEIATAIREIWPDVTGKFAFRLIRAFGNPFHNSIFQKKMGVKVPSLIKQKLKNSDFFEHTSKFVEAVRQMARKC